jgi:hypothetical protein
MNTATRLQDVAVEDADAHALSILMLQSSQRTPEGLERLVQVPTCLDSRRLGIARVAEL